MGKQGWCIRVKVDGEGDGAISCLLDRMSILSPPAEFIAADDPVPVQNHIPLDQALNEKIFSEE